MATSIPIVNTSTDPFGTVITRLNQCANAFTYQALTANNNANGAFVTGNSYLFGIFGANNIAVFNSISGGNVQVANVLTVASNLAISGNIVTVGNSTVNAVINTVAFVASNLTVQAVLTFSGLVVGGNAGTNSTAFYVGNSTVSSVTNSSITLMKGSGSNALLSALSLTIGNSTVNSVLSSNLLTIGVSNLSSLGLTVGTSVINSTVLAAGANVGSNTTAHYVGNSTVNGVFTAQSLVFGGNAGINATSIFVGNSTSNVVINSSAVSISGASLVTTAQRDAVAWANSLVGAASRINFVSGNNVFLNITNDTVGNQINVQINAVATSGAAIVGGGDTSVQFNDNGNFNGDNARMSFVRSSSILTVANTIVSNVFQVSQYCVITGNSAAFVNSVGVDTIDAFPLASYRSAEYIYSIKNNGANGYQTGKVIMLQDGANAYIEEYGVAFSNSLLGAFNGWSNATHAILQFTPVSNMSYTATFSRQVLPV